MSLSLQVAVLAISYIQRGHIKLQVTKLEFFFLKHNLLSKIYNNHEDHTDF
jgi:hypothetical protein